MSYEISEGLKRAFGIGEKPILPFQIRPATMDDAGFMVRPWLQELRKSPTTVYIDDAIYFERQRRLVHALLERDPAFIACNPDNAGHAYGFICFSAEATHWLYVVSTFRLMGIGSTLLGFARTAQRLEPGAAMVCSHASGIFGLKSLRERYSLRYDPYILKGMS